MRGFDDPDAVAAQQQAEHLAHDMRMDMAAVEAPEEPGGLFDLFGADEPEARAELRALDTEVSDLARVRSCLRDPGATT